MDWRDKNQTNVACFFSWIIAQCHQGFSGRGVFLCLQVIAASLFLRQRAAAYKHQPPTRACPSRWSVNTACQWLARRHSLSTDFRHPCQLMTAPTQHMRPLQIQSATLYACFKSRKVWLRGRRCVKERGKLVRSPYSLCLFF